MKRQNVFFTFFAFQILIFSGSVSHAQTGTVVSEDEIEHAYCRPQIIPSSSEIVDYLNVKGTSTRISAKVHGVLFQNESSQLVSFFRDLTTRLGFYGDPYPKFQTDLAQEFSIPPSCDKVFCAAEKIWGYEDGLKILYLMARYGYNTSHLAFIYSQPLESDELEDVMRGVLDLPRQVMIPRDRFKPLYRANKILEQKWGQGVCSNAVIMLFSGWTRLSRLNRQMAIFHELAHNLSFLEEPTLDHTPEWLAMGGWSAQVPAGKRSRPSGRYWKTSLTPDQWVSSYCSTNPSEDFAESVVAYRYAPARLKALSIAKYQYIRNRVFKGIEFFSERSCPE